jgi:hypothetical protein
MRRPSDATRGAVTDRVNCAIVRALLRYLRH